MILNGLNNFAGLFGVGIVVLGFVLYSWIYDHHKKKEEQLGLENQNED